MVSTDTFPMAMVEALARAFALGLHRELSLETLAEIDATNAGWDGDACASHEWVDANEAMDAAFFVVMRRAFQVDAERDMALWNAAWRHARAVGFAVLAREAGR